MTSKTSYYEHFEREIENKAKRKSNKRQKKMKVSGKSVLKLKNLITKGK